MIHLCPWSSPVHCYLKELNIICFVACVCLCLYWPDFHKRYKFMLSLGGAFLSAGLLPYTCAHSDTWKQQSSSVEESAESRTPWYTWGKHFILYHIRSRKICFSKYSSPSHWDHRTNRYWSVLFVENMFNTQRNIYIYCHKLYHLPSIFSPLYIILQTLGKTRALLRER